MKRIARKYLAIAILPLAILLYKPIMPAFVLALGEKILLETLPLDPRDFLRGDYVTLDYAISHVPMTYAQKEIFEKDHTEKQDVFVSLRVDKQGVAQAERVSLAKPPSGPYIKGVIVYMPRKPDEHGEAEGEMRIFYGIDVYYVKENTGRTLEEAVREGKVLADVRIWRGIPVLKELVIDDHK